MDRFEIVERSAGQGGYGRIDQALDTTLDRPVAIKTLDPLFKMTLQDDDIERFRREAKSLARLSHPNIPAIYDVEFNPSIGQFKIIFEWVEGATLSNILQERGVLSVDEARTVCEQICAALSHAHAKGIVHRDVKPSNIILTESLATSYLVDFGIALREDDISRLTSGTSIGSIGYMSPEQERGDEVSSTSDIYSLGIVLYESLAGTRPIVAGYTSLTLHNESIPPGVDDLIKRTLHEDPAERPQDANEFMRLFRTALRPHETFAAILVDGSLHEIQLGLHAMSPEAYEVLPPGQRMLITTRLRDLTDVDDARLRRAVAALLVEMLRIAYRTVVEKYAIFIALGFEYGFDKRYGETWVGDLPVRRKLADVSLICPVGAHDYMTKEALKRVSAGEATERGWYAHDLRVILQNLLINAVCNEDQAMKLGDALSMLNRSTH